MPQPRGRTQNRNPVGARCLVKANGRERKGLPSFDPMLISASRSVPATGRRSLSLLPICTLLLTRCYGETCAARVHTLGGPFRPGRRCAAFGRHCLRVRTLILTPITMSLSDVRGRCSALLFPFLYDGGQTRSGQDLPPPRQTKILRWCSLLVSLRDDRGSLYGNCNTDKDDVYTRTRV